LLPILLPALGALSAVGGGRKVPDRCRLYGRIQFVEAFPDYRIQWVDAFPGCR
jgi:hypothetical protein